jgi:ecdysteroid 2-hydroxylase
MFCNSRVLRHLTYFSATVAVLMGEKYWKHQQQLENIVSHLASVVHLIFQESARLSLIPVTVAAFLKISAWKNFVSAVDEALSLGKNLNTTICVLYV